MRLCLWFQIICDYNDLILAVVLVLTTHNRNVHHAVSFKNQQVSFVSCTVSACTVDRAFLLAQPHRQAQGPAVREAFNVTV